MDQSKVFQDMCISIATVRAARGEGNADDPARVIEWVSLVDNDLVAARLKEHETLIVTTNDYVDWVLGIGKHQPIAN